MLAEVKSYLQITWEDEETDKRLSSILTRAEAALSRYAGAEIDFEANEDERQLLFDCCRYIYNHAYEHFANDFAEELIQLRQRYAVEAYHEQQTEVSDV